VEILNARQLKIQIKTIANSEIQKENISNRILDTDYNIKMGFSINNKINSSNNNRLFLIIKRIITIILKTKLNIKQKCAEIGKFTTHATTELNVATPMELMNSKEKLMSINFTEPENVNCIMNKAIALTAPDVILSTK
jgi:hypothetical protein